MHSSKLTLKLRRLPRVTLTVIAGPSVGSLPLESATTPIGSIMETYQPQPRDTSGVKLPDEIVKLTEDLAEHIHDKWAQQRIAEHWKYGPQRNDTKQEHPCLVPYDKLPVTEQEYDRTTALEALKAIIALGYRIVPLATCNAGESGPSQQEQARANQLAMLTKLRAISGTKEELPELLKTWGARDNDELMWQVSPDLYRHLGLRLLKLGAALLAKEVVRTALGFEITVNQQSHHPWAKDVELRQIQGVILNRTANPDEAQVVLNELYQEGNTHEETLGNLARTYKDQGLMAPVGSPQRQAALQKALDLYWEAATRNPNAYWSMINVATLARLLGDHARSRSLARQVQEMCEPLLEVALRDQQDTYWLLATLGEAALNGEDMVEAERRYRQTRAVVQRHFSDLNSTRRHVVLLLESLVKPPELVDEWLPRPKVAVFAGHMIDGQKRLKPRFPAELAGPVKRTISEWLQRERVEIGFASAACGGDLLFHEALQELGGESRIVLPYDVPQFREDSVQFAGAEWLTRFDTVLEKATRVVMASPQKMASGSISYEYANLMLHGLASVRATELQTELLGLAVWDGQPGDGPGGTASVITRWHTLGLPVYQVDLSVSSPPPLLPSSPPLLSTTRANGECGDAERDPAPFVLPVIRNTKPPSQVCYGPDGRESGTRIMAMLFGDAVNFSKLTEDQVPRFVQHFLTPIAELLKTRYHQTNVVKNTWGDGLYLVFDSVSDAGNCALDICEFITRNVREQRWQELGLPERLNMRIALHAGPVFGCTDPVTGQPNFTGTHVSRAARLEPRTPEGEVYASEAFAALCAEQRMSDFTCQYVEQLAWAKQYGSFPTYVVRRSASKLTTRSVVPH
ncbi:MAG: RyR domain-containing protein [Planctomycetaceae bacterium]